jgi:hypothetical protein
MKGIEPYKRVMSLTSFAGTLRLRLRAPYPGRYKA